MLITPSNNTSMYPLGDVRLYPIVKTQEEEGQKVNTLYKSKDKIELCLVFS